MTYTSLRFMQSVDEYSSHLIEGCQVEKRWGGVPARIWKWAAFSVACVALPLMGQIDWKTLVLDHQPLIIGALAVVAASATIFEVLVGNHRNNRRYEDFERRAPIAQSRRREDEENRPHDAHGRRPKRSPADRPSTPSTSSRYKRRDPRKPPA